MSSGLQMLLHNNEARALAITKQQRRRRVTKVVADALPPIWHHVICNHRDDIGQSSHVGNGSM